MVRDGSCAHSCAGGAYASALAPVATAWFEILGIVSSGERRSRFMLRPSTHAFQDLR